MSAYASKRQTEKEKVAEQVLDNLNMRIEKLLSRIEDTDMAHKKSSKFDVECVVCLNAAATMRTLPCGHTVLCRKCLLKTMQVAVSQRCLPLRCVVCRDRILRLQKSPKLGNSTTIPIFTQSPSLPDTDAFPTQIPAPTNLFRLFSGAFWSSSLCKFVPPFPSSRRRLPQLTSSFSAPSTVPGLSELTRNDAFSERQTFVRSASDTFSLPSLVTECEHQVATSSTKCLTALPEQTTTLQKIG